MADRVLMPRALDTNGDIVSGAVAYFFETGTTTPLTVYSDSDALTELGVSATADATGTFPAVYTNQTLRMDMQDSFGVSLPGFPSDSWYIVPANGVGASVITFEPVEGNPATTVQTAIENLTALWVAVTTYGRTLIAAADAAAARVALGLGGAAVVDVIDEDSFATNSATRPPSQQSTKAYIASRPMWDYVSSPTAITVSSNMTFTHGLGVAPSIISVDAVCKVAGAGFSVGDVIYDVENIDGAGAARSLLKYVQTGNTTTIRVNVGADLFILNADNTISTATSNFDLIVKAKK